MADGVGVVKGSRLEGPRSRAPASEARYLLLVVTSAG